MKDEIAELIEKIKAEEIKPYHSNPAMGLPCPKCRSENPEYNEPTTNPVILTYKKDGHWETVYFHRNCLEAQ